jgi:dihydrolipoamide dehydrogenase
MKNFIKPKKFDYNLIVIGAGSAGLVTSYIASALKAKVALIEKHKMGGDCLNTGCVPSKALIRSAKILHYAKRSKEFGINKMSSEYDFAEIMERVQKVIAKVEPHDSVERYTKLGVNCFQGEAKIRSPFEVEINGKILTTKNIVVATGAKPFVPPIPGIELVNYYTSDTIWSIREIPKRLLILGGGPIGCELAQCLNRFGANVTQVQSSARILNREDLDVSEFITEQFRKEGVNVLLNHRGVRIEIENKNKFLICDNLGTEKKIEFDQILFALGRKANVSGFGVEELGVEISKTGTIEVDSFLRTNIPNIYVAGDAAGPYQFTHCAAHQAWYASVNALFSPLKSFKADYSIIPWCTFTDPEVAHVGLSEQTAKEKNINYEVTKYELDDLDRAIADSEDKGFIKVLTKKGTDKILGVTIVGNHAGDLLAEYVLAMKHNIGLNKILNTIHTYPTMAEANKYVAGVWKRNHAPQKILKLLEIFHNWRRS